MNNLIAMMVIILSLSGLALLSMFDTQPRETKLEWASTECAQGNSDACQLERNLLTDER